ncbi:hypothetical protein F5148DRAFT_775408 [Russula earlei]|uniref:Uncharacterized protein n=1 Tax=Russula earlei TaxID=71964 RepID=A0ACC0TTX1_9AGAM|nr:hypothetical protein F5148DRAFT_775408 [Russula earlei]
MCAPLLKQHILRTLSMTNEELASFELIIAQAWDQWDHQVRPPPRHTRAHDPSNPHPSPPASAASITLCSTSTSRCGQGHLPERSLSPVRRRLAHRHISLSRHRPSFVSASTLRQYLSGAHHRSHLVRRSRHFVHRSPPPSSTGQASSLRPHLPSPSQHRPPSPSPPPRLPPPP